MFPVEQVWPIFGPVEADRDNILSCQEQSAVLWNSELKPRSSIFNILQQNSNWISEENMNVA